LTNGLQLSGAIRASARQSSQESERNRSRTSLCGRPTRPQYASCLSARRRLSVCHVYTGSTRKLKGAVKTKICTNVSQSRSNRCANFQF